MSVQIRIDGNVMCNAGWKAQISGKEGRFVYDDHSGSPEWIPGQFWAEWKKGELVLKGHCSPDFVADCRYEGHNHQLFEELGLLELPHSFE